MEQKTLQPVFGLNLLCDIVPTSGEASSVEGSYDPEQQLWTVNGEVLAQAASATCIQDCHFTANGYDVYYDSWYYYD